MPRWVEVETKESLARPTKVLIDLDKVYIVLPHQEVSRTDLCYIRFISADNPYITLNMSYESAKELILSDSLNKLIVE